MSFSAVILAGGQSSRMGRDKALLDIGGKPLLARQIQLVRQAGATEIFISAHANPDYSAFDCRVLADELPGAGPLAGIARALDVAREPLLLVLAVDMANLTSAFLSQLYAHCRRGMGAVPVHSGIVEPLAAFYPKPASELSAGMLARKKPGASPGAKDFAAECERTGLAQFVTVSPADAELLRSWNCPADLPAEQRNS
jgi:molybdopterin-guanine dinucleotide biosynthesis protein A